MDSLSGGSRSSVTQGSGDAIFSDRFEDTSTAPRDFARRVLERLTYGARPEDIDAFLSLGGNDAQRLSAWLDQQLAWSSLADGDCDQRLAAASYQTIDKTIEQLWADHVRGDQDRYLPVAETEAARILRAVYSERQLYELMTEFWHDHFNIAGWEFSLAPVFSHYDREAVRPHALGNFRQLLEAVARSTAMLLYLDNHSNRAGGFNENWARELMELHTLGSEVYFPGAAHGQIEIGDDGLAVGYSDADVYDVARCFTGWTIRNGHWDLPDLPEYDTGGFVYYANWHEGGSKFVLGNWINPLGQLEAGLVMDFLCMHRQTAQHVCEKICRRLIDDDPPQALVDSAAQVWNDHWQSDDQIARVVRHVLTSDAFLQGTGQKVRRPFEMMCAAMRKAGAEIEPQPTGGWDPYGELLSRLRQTGHGCFRWPSPDGYPDRAERWTSASVMGQTWRLLSRLTETDDAADVEFLLRIHDVTVAGLPAAANRSAEGLVDFWLERLIGSGVEADRRTALIDFMRQNAAADEPLDITSNLPNGSWSANDLKGHYTPVRLRSAVAMMMMLPEFYQR